MLAGSVAAILAPELFAQKLVPVRLMVVRRLGLAPTNQCVAPCIRGSIYDLSTQAAPLDQTVLPLLKTLVPICDVIERPWKGNQANVSSIPKGIYTASVRTDASKPWMKSLDQKWRLELGGTAPRSAIQFHYGMDVSWSEGCFIVGTLLQKGDASGITTRYCKLENGEAAIAALRAVVMANGRDPKNITIGVADDSDLFPGMRPSEPC
ncbi:hypothetical protein CEJ42_05870 [Herbaspirillum robiniae]|uniref:DUF5675 domain-containing protein n=2 Tax=Herbaspirillum robiniae TaxID=2014887 RepID=A0A246WT25_9BURK|nr:hypothetical protein CEJ42_05870 [Herbaspirillum robiniae]